jgi:hypothetical protein
VLSSNPDIAGPLPACYLASPALTELQLDGLSLDGALPPLAPNAPLSYLYLGSPNPSAAGRLTGTVPASYGGAGSKLRHLHLRGHRLTGALPSLPAGLQLLDVGYNAFEGGFPSLQGTALDYVDVSNNRLTGPLPSDLAGLAPVSEGGLFEVGGVVLIPFLLLWQTTSYSNNTTNQTTTTQTKRRSTTLTRRPTASRAASTRCASLQGCCIWTSPTTR